ncbi:hypothetical protein AAG565_08055 [Fontimonas sp. SYSU GA230001]|uniref:hypothetical protein n=1 Tax=Fontimonas sp. SYSU GA230001 TaxID=3142450 RepID=UPI0032B595A1
MDPRPPQERRTAVPRDDETPEDLPVWLRWFANLGLSLSAADCALMPAARRRTVQPARRLRV